MPTSTVIDRPGYGGGGTEELAALYTQQRRQNPAFRAPAGYEWKGDHYERDNHGLMDTLGKYAPLVGLGIGGAAAAGAFGGGAAAAGAGGGAASGVPAGLPGAVDLGSLGLGGGAAGAGGAAASGGGGILNWLKNPSNWSNLLSGAGDIGSVLGGQAQGAAEGRHLDALLNNQQDAIRSQNYNRQQDAQFGAGALDLQRQQFSEGARGNRGRQAIAGNLLANLQDLAISVPGIQNAQINGGLRPSALGAGGRGAASELAKQAMLKLMAPDQFTGGEILTPPELTPIPQPSGWENAAGIGGILGTLGGAVGSAFGRPRGQQPPPIRR